MGGTSSDKSSRHRDERSSCAALNQQSSIVLPIRERARESGDTFSGRVVPFHYDTNDRAAVQVVVFRTARFAIGAGNPPLQVCKR